MTRISLRTNPPDSRNDIKRETVSLSLSLSIYLEDCVDTVARARWERAVEGEGVSSALDLGRFVYVYIHTARVRLIHLGMRHRKYHMIQNKSIYHSNFYGY